MNPLSISNCGGLYGQALYLILKQVVALRRRDVEKKAKQYAA